MSGMPSTQRKLSPIIRAKLKDIELALNITADLLIKSAYMIYKLDEESFEKLSKYLFAFREKIQNIPSIVFEARWLACRRVDHVILDLAMTKIANPSKFEKITNKLKKSYEKIYALPPAGSPHGTTAAIFASMDLAATKPSDAPSP